MRKPADLPEDSVSVSDPTHRTQAVFRDLSPQASATGNQSDARLVELARRGDHDAFAGLVRRYEGKLIRVVTRLVRDQDLALDLAQETFWKVYNRLDRFDTSRRFGPWLFQVGINLTLDFLRSTRHPTASLEARRIATEVAQPDPRMQADLNEEVHHVISRLPLEYRSVLVLRDLEDFSSSEVAAIVGRREATVRWRLARARELFRQGWERRQLERAGYMEGSTHPNWTKPSVCGKLAPGACGEQDHER